MVTKPKITPIKASRNSLGIPPQVYTELLSKLAEVSKPAKPAGKPRRRHTRLEYHDPYLELSISNLEQSRNTITVAARNISRAGLSVLHANYIYPGTNATARLKRIDGTCQSVSGVVVRCEHRGGVVHEIGIRFHLEINPQEFVRADTLNAIRSLEYVDPDQLSGSVIVVGQDPAVLDAVLPALKPTRVEARHIPNPQDCLALDLSDTDIFLICTHMQAMTGPELTILLRNSGFKGPVILAGKPGSKSDEGCIRLSTADMFVPTPIDEQDLMRSLGEYLLHRWSVESLQRARQPEDPRSIDTLREEIAKLSIQLDQQTRTQNPTGVHSICKRIASIAPLMGTNALRELALKVSDQVESNGLLNDTHEHIENIRLMCSSIRKAA